MDYNNLSQIIASLGFPIVTAVALFWYICTMTKELTKAIDNNTTILVRLLEKFNE